MKNIKIEKLSDREHILRRPSMYIGGISSEKIEEFQFVDEALKVMPLEYPPGLIKIINEVIDNSIDAILKTGVGTQVEVQIDNSMVVVSDNSTGFPEPEEGVDPHHEPVVLALGNARAGSNFNDEDNIGQMGTNGVGAFATNCFSTSFVATTTNKNRKIKAMWGNNASFIAIEHFDTTRGAGGTGTVVEFKPDLERFGLNEITLDVIQAIKTRLACLAYTYPKIKFLLNNDKFKAPNKITDWLSANEDPYIHHKGSNYEVFVVARSSSTQNFSFVNGLNIKDGGTHLDVITNDISKGLQSARGFNGVNKSDISNTLQIIFVGAGFKNLRFNSQTKEKITNSTQEVREYLGPLDALVSKITKSKEIKGFIKATTLAREMRTNKSKLTQAKKAKIKSDKFLDAQGHRKILMLVEGDSAMGGLVPSLGRREIAYYALKGKPLNAWSATTQKLTANKELSEVLGIIHNSDFERIVIGTDQDLDGLHIRGLLLGFVFKYIPEYMGRLYFLQTPVKAVFKDDEIIRWSFNLNDNLNPKKSERIQYFKGLGSFDPQDIRAVIKSEGFEQMLDKVIISSEDREILEAWLGSDTKSRKEMILDNEFNIAKI